MQTVAFWAITGRDDFEYILLYMPCCNSGLKASEERRHFGVKGRLPSDDIPWSSFLTNTMKRKDRS